MPVERYIQLVALPGKIQFKLAPTKTHSLLVGEGWGWGKVGRADLAGRAVLVCYRYCRVGRAGVGRSLERLGRAP